MDGDMDGRVDGWIKERLNRNILRKKRGQRK